MHEHEFIKEEHDRDYPKARIELLDIAVVALQSLGCDGRI